MLRSLGKVTQCIRFSQYSLGLAQPCTDINKAGQQSEILTQPCTVTNKTGQKETMATIPELVAFDRSEISKAEIQFVMKQLQDRLSNGNLCTKKGYIDFKISDFENYMQTESTNCTPKIATSSQYECTNCSPRQCTSDKRTERTVYIQTGTRDFTQSYNGVCSVPLSLNDKPKMVITRTFSTSSTDNRNIHRTTSKRKYSDIKWTDENSCSSKKSKLTTKTDKAKNVLSNHTRKTCDENEVSGGDNIKRRGIKEEDLSWLPPVSKFVALDCEFVGVGPRGSKNALGRCSIVDYEGKVILDEYCLPEESVTDYRTRFSGISRRHLWGAQSFNCLQKHVMDIVKDKIVIGHAVKCNDFKVLGIRVEPGNIRDTASYRPLGLLAGTTMGLKHLSQELLGRHIQAGPHCSVEDARACLDLYKLVRYEWEATLAKTKCPPVYIHPIHNIQCLREEEEDSKNYLDDRYWPTWHDRK